MSQPSFGSEGAVDGKFSVRSRALGTHVYGGPAYGPFAKCWFDYGKDAVNELQGLPEDNPHPWFHPAMMLTTESHALGLVNDNPSEVEVEVWADTAMSVLFNKLMIAHYDELPDEQAWAPGTMTLQDGEYSTLKVPMEGVFAVLEAGGVEFASDDEIAAISELSNKTLTIALDQFGSPVVIEAPPKDTLMDVSSQEQLEAGPDLCAAAS